MNLKLGFPGEHVVPPDGSSEQPVYVYRNGRVMLSIWHRSSGDTAIRMRRDQPGRSDKSMFGVPGVDTIITKDGDPLTLAAIAHHLLGKYDDKHTHKAKDQPPHDQTTGTDQAHASAAEAVE